MHHSPPFDLLYMWLRNVHAAMHHPQPCCPGWVYPACSAKASNSSGFNGERSERSPGRDSQRLQRVFP